MKHQDSKKMTDLGLESRLNLMKYPKIPAVIQRDFDSYGPCANLIKRIFFYLLEQYQPQEAIADQNGVIQAPLDSFLGAKWIEFTPEDLAEKIGLSLEYILTKTEKYKGGGYRPYQLIHKRLPKNKTKWKKKHHDIYSKLIKGTGFIYDCMLSDALYRMMRQPIYPEHKIDKSLEHKWIEYYPTGFTILDHLKIYQSARGQIKNIRLKLSDKIVYQIHLLFTLVAKEELRLMIQGSRGHLENSDLYLYLSQKRNIHLFDENPKSPEEPDTIPLAILFQKTNLKYKKEAGDKDVWRYDNARKHLRAHLQKLTNTEVLESFELSRITHSNKKSVAILSYAKAQSRELKEIDKFNKARQALIYQKWLSTYYIERLKPRLHPWDPAIKNATEIKEKYSNQEYYSKWLSDEGLNIKEKREAIEVAYNEIFKDAPYTQEVDYVFKQVTLTAQSRLQNNKIGQKSPPIISSEDDRVAKIFTEAFYYHFGKSYQQDIDKELKEEVVKKHIHQYQLSPELLFTLFINENFKEKTIKEYCLKQQKLIAEYNEEGYKNLLEEFCLYCKQLNSKQYQELIQCY